MLWGMCKNGNPESEKTMGKKLPYQVLLVTFRTEDLPVLFPLKVLLSWWKCYEQAMAHAHTHTHTHTHAQKPREEQHNENFSAGIRRPRIIWSPPLRVFIFTMMFKETAKRWCHMLRCMHRNKEPSTSSREASVNGKKERKEKNQKRRRKMQTQKKLQQEWDTNLQQTTPFFPHSLQRNAAGTRRKLQLMHKKKHISTHFTTTSTGCGTELQKNSLSFYFLVSLINIKWSCPDITSWMTGY